MQRKTLKNSQMTQKNENYIKRKYLKSNTFSLKEEQLFEIHKKEKENFEKKLHRDAIFTTNLPSQKPELLRKERGINLYMGENISIKMPKFMKEDFFEKKCQEILRFDECSVEKRTSKFYDEGPILKLRKCYNK